MNKTMSSVFFPKFFRYKILRGNGLLWNRTPQDSVGVYFEYFGVSIIKRAGNVRIIQWCIPFCSGRVTLYLLILNKHNFPWECMINPNLCYIFWIRATTSKKIPYIKDNRICMDTIKRRKPGIIK